MDLADKSTSELENLLTKYESDCKTSGLIFGCSTIAEVASIAGLIIPRLIKSFEPSFEPTPLLPYEQYLLSTSITAE